MMSFDLANTCHSYKAQGQANLSFKEAVNQGLEENPNLASAEANLEASRIQYCDCQGKLSPRIECYWDLFLKVSRQLSVRRQVLFHHHLL